MGDLTKTLDIASSGLAAQARRLNIVSQNIANADTPGYRRKQVAFAQVADGTAKGGVRMARVSLDQRTLTRIHDPSHPMSDAQGYYFGSNVDLMVEVADAREAQRSYEANLRSFDNARQMTRSLLELLRK